MTSQRSNTLKFQLTPLGREVVSRIWAPYFAMGGGYDPLGELPPVQQSHRVYHILYQCLREGPLTLGELRERYRGHESYAEQPPIPEATVDESITVLTNNGICDIDSQGRYGLTKKGTMLDLHI